MGAWIARCSRRPSTAAPVNDDGRSGATLERVRLADGSRVVVKRFDPAVDLVMRMTGDTRGREVELWQRGILDGLPPTVLHAALDGWYDDHGGVLVMRDLGDAVLTLEVRGHQGAGRDDVPRGRRPARGVPRLAHPTD